MKHKKQIKTPTLGVNAKAYMWGEELLTIAKYCEKIAVDYDVTVTLNVPCLLYTSQARSIVNFPKTMAAPWPHVRPAY